MTDDDRALLGRNSTAVPGFDKILGGGLFVGGVYLIAGRPGAGKTTLANQIAFNHVANGGRALYITLLAESHARMLLLMESMSFFRPDAVGDSLQYISAYQTLEKEKLAGLTRLLRGAVRDHRATLLVIDGLLTALDLAETEIELKKFIHELQILAELAGCTSLLLRGAHESGETYPERTMADGLILLTTTRIGMRSIREIEVQKHRGSSHVMGSSFFEISSDGLSIHPRTEARIGLDSAPSEEASATLVTTGIASLDSVLHGGLPRGSTTTLLGSPGIGKTTLGLQFLDAGARAKEPCLYVGFTESPARIVRKAASIGLDLAAHVKTGLLEIQWHPPQEPLADRLAEIVFDNIRRRNVRRVFIDGFAGFRAGLIYPERVQAFATSFNNELRALGVTAMFSEEMAGVFQADLVIPPGAATMVDNILHLRYVELRSQIRRLIAVMKLADHAYEASLREFHVTNRGLVIASTFETAEALLTGTAALHDGRSPRQPAAKPSKKSAKGRSKRARG
jgi:circadian clock protein KaiC